MTGSIAVSESVRRNPVFAGINPEIKLPQIPKWEPTNPNWEPTTPTWEPPTPWNIPAPWRPGGSLGGGLNRETYTADNQQLPYGQLGRLVRKEGSWASRDMAIDAAHDNAKVVYDFFHKVLGRDSLDDNGMKLKSTAHYGQDFNNAFWDGTHMTYGDGDGRLFTSLSGSLDVVAHEMAHAVTERSAHLDYHNQPGALNESFSDVLGEFAEQWHENPEGFKSVDGAKVANWQIGEDVFTPGVSGDALRSLKAPGTAYKGDPQPGTMTGYKNLPDTRPGDNGGVHINSGIPNHAAYQVATRIGGHKTAQIWYRALTKYLKPTSQFQDAVNATVQSAIDLYKDGPEASAVRDGWTLVGLPPTMATITPRRNFAPLPSTPNPGIVPPWMRDASRLENGDLNPKLAPASATIGPVETPTVYRAKNVGHS